jgi:hypothetical protein
MRMARNMAKNAKKIALFAKFRTHRQTKMKINENETCSKMLILSDALFI